MKVKNARTTLGPAGAHPAIIHASDVVDRVWRKVVGKHPILTGLAEEGHSEGSLHYGIPGDPRCRALDFRDNLEPSERIEVNREVRKRLGEGEFDLVWEGNHLHVEFDPK